MKKKTQSLLTKLKKHSLIALMLVLFCSSNLFAQGTNGQCPYMSVTFQGCRNQKADGNVGGCPTPNNIYIPYSPYWVKFTICVSATGYQGTWPICLETYKRNGTNPTWDTLKRNIWCADSGNEYDAVKHRFRSTQAGHQWTQIDVDTTHTDTFTYPKKICYDVCMQVDCNDEIRFQGIAGYNSSAQCSHGVFDCSFNVVCPNNYFEGPFNNSCTNPNGPPYPWSNDPCPPIFVEPCH